MAGLPLDITGLKADTVNQTLDTIRDQKDQEQDVTLHGLIQFSTDTFQTPATFETNTPRRFLEQPEGRHFVYGLVLLEGGFDGIPHITFGQEAVKITGELSAASKATNYVPFLVMPYVYEWKYTNNQVDGFILGLYALTVPPTTPQVHRIFWSASGTSSRYRDVEQDESWNQSYDHNDPSFLEHEVPSSFDSEEAPEYADGEEPEENINDGNPGTDTNADEDVDDATPNEADDVDIEDIDDVDPVQPIVDPDPNVTPGG